MSRRSRVGLRVPMHRATTAHARVLYPWHFDDGLGQRGVYLGTDISGGGAPWCFDPFQLYTDGRITSPNMVVLGQVGSGKSAAVKTMLARTIGQLRSPSGGPRWCAVLDPKGEYGALAELLGLAHVKLHPGGTARLNPLDGAGGASRAGAVELTAALTSVALRRELTAMEEAVLGTVIWELTTSRRRPVLADVVARLASPSEHVAARAGRARDDLAADLLELRHGLGRLVDGALRNMFDGPTTEALPVEGRGVVIDLSAVHHDREALTAVMIAATGWLQSVMIGNAGLLAPRRIQVFEEVWALLADERAARYVQACQKLARTYGVANVLVAHRAADFRAQSADGTAAAKIGAGLIAETQTRVLFRLPSDQLGEATELFGLSETERQILPQLRRGRALWHVASHRAVVQHDLAPHERALTSTDAAMALG